jgi:AraC-like DNA-binding protein
MRFICFDEFTAPVSVRLGSLGIADLVPRSWNFSCAVSSFWTLYCNDRDGAWISVDGRRTGLRRGSVFLIPPGMTFDTGCCARLRHLYIYFLVDGLDRWAVQRAIPQPVRVRCKTHFLDEIARRAPSHVSSADQARIISLIASALAPKFETHAAWFDRGDVMLSPAFARITRHYPDPLSVADLAAECGLAVDAFARRFRRATGHTPIQWLRAHRARVAAQLMLNTDWTLDRVARAVGCGSRAYFSRLFISCIGMGPSEYRRGRLSGTVLPGAVRLMDRMDMDRS